MSLDKIKAEEGDNDNNNDYYYVMNLDDIKEVIGKDDKIDCSTSLSSSSLSPSPPQQFCSICNGTRYIDSWRKVECYFCNGTGEYTKAAESFMKAHPCQCVHSDRKNCSLCKQKCHHSSNNKPKVLFVKSPPPS